jgi:threonine/homoserine/homoserine lactone efflux protein
MTEALGEILVLAVAVAVTPIPIVLVALVLPTPRGVRKGLMLLAGWIGGLCAVGAVVLLVAPDGDAGERPTWVSVAKLALGLALWALAVHQWRDRSTGEERGALPGWAAAVDRLSGAKLALTGFAASALNPKTLVLGAAAAASIAGTGASTAAQAGAYAAFVAIGSLGVIVPLALSALLGPRAEPALIRLRDWMTTNSTAILVVLLLLIGAKLVGDAIGALG